MLTHPTGIASRHHTETTMKPKTHKINVEPIPGCLYADNRLIVEGYSTHFCVGVVPEGEEGRKVYQGPLVPGPWAFAFGLCTVIDARGGTAREVERQRSEGRLVEARVGDIIVADGHKYRIAHHDQRKRHHIDLIAC